MNRIYIEKQLELVNLKMSEQENEIKKIGKNSSLQFFWKIMVQIYQFIPTQFIPKKTIWG